MTATAGPEDFFDMDLGHDLDDGDHRPWFWGEKKHEEKGGGYSENDLNPSLQEREEAAEMEDR
jgi:hypothetical protein